ncbi:protein of unknown function [Candidatus Nitrospira inopinata]|uniref:Uncharacterized protein n=1 Tax=Candidatus Nitrospira inopinata TaxID=1715989 RepID=A0A0S4KNP6_9BACT|nr:protein of unknown function [Candidatus Nitrospira inopinata]
MGCFTRRTAEPAKNDALPGTAEDGGTSQRASRVEMLRDWGLLFFIQHDETSCVLVRGGASSRQFLLTPTT